MEVTKTGLEEGRIRSALIERLGEGGVLAGQPESSPYRLKGVLQALPENEAQVAEVLRFADENRLSVVPRGGGTKDAYSQTTAAADIILSTKRLSGVVEHSAGDLMVTVQAGTTFRELQQTLKTAGQFIPLDVAWDDQSTVGGIIHSNASGPLRAGYGSVRDMVIASRIVYPDGKVIRTGAKVVKNVAGYDMNKLFIGSMGTLGVHTEFTFKIRPIPVGQQLIVFGGASSDIMRSLQETVSDSHLEPCVFEWMNPSAASLLGFETKGPVLLAGFADVWPSVDEQVRIAKDFASALGAVALGEIRGDEAFESALAQVRGLLPNAAQTENGRSLVSLKLMGKLTDVQAMYERAEARAAESGIGLKFSAGALVGIARATVEAAGNDQDESFGRLAAWILVMQQDMKTIGVRTVTDFAPGPVRDRISIWGEATADQKIMHGIKRTVDPNGILNPGRILGGL
jgi:glycolate oxidase FAD binding subunit